MIKKWLNKIHLGDCIDVLKKIPPSSVDLVFADPPYNLSGRKMKLIGNKTGGDWYMMNEEWDRMTTKEYLNFTGEWIKLCKRVLKENGSIYVCSSYHNIGEILMTLKQNGFDTRNIITWYKTNAMPNLTHRTFTHASEYVIFATKGKKWIFNYDKIKQINPKRTKDGSLKQMRDVWVIPLVQGKERLKNENGRAVHPTQKPEEMLRRIIIASSNKGDIVLDPFIGSGTTAVVAEKLKRHWIGIEKKKRYVELANERINLQRSQSCLRDFETVFHKTNEELSCSSKGKIDLKT